MENIEIREQHVVFYTSIWFFAYATEMANQPHDSVWHSTKMST